MARHYDSFLVRIWRLSGGVERVEVEHVQSGERARLASLDGAVSWITRRGHSAYEDGPPASESSELGSQPSA